MAGPRHNSVQKQFTGQDLRNAGIPILMLNIPVSAQIHIPDTSCEEVFNTDPVQACVKESWRTSPKNLKRAKLILATKKQDNAPTYTREILGVFEYTDAGQDKQPNNNGYRCSHFIGVRPAAEEWIEKFKDGVIVGLNPRATNPLRYFIDPAEHKSLSHKKSNKN